jgi:hypothetical protein
MNKDLIGSLAWAGGLIGLGLVASFARRQGYIDADTTTRIVLAAIGLMVAWFGNRMPKAFVPSARARQAARVGGWSMALSGLVYAGLWAFAPFEAALFGGCAAIIVGMAVTLGYCLTLRAGSKAA